MAQGTVEPAKGGLGVSAPHDGVGDTSVTATASASVYENGTKSEIPSEFVALSGRTHGTSLSRVGTGHKVLNRTVDQVARKHRVVVEVRTRKHRKDDMR